MRLRIAPEGLREHLKELPYETLPYGVGRMPCATTQHLVILPSAISHTVPRVGCQPWGTTVAVSTN